MTSHLNLCLFTTIMLQVKVVQTTIAPAVKPLATAAPASILPALSPASATSSFTGSLPDGISLKVEPSASLIASAGTLAVGEAVHSEGGTSVAGSVADARIGLAAFGGDFGVGEKRPRCDDSDRATRAEGLSRLIFDALPSKSHTYDTDNAHATLEFYAVDAP